MKKILVCLTMLVLCVAGIQAAESAGQVESTYQATTYYEGPAWSVGSGMIPQAADTIQIKWTSDGLWINGDRSDLRVYSVSGGTFLIRVNGRSKYCSHYINYGGERYFFVAN